MARLSGAVDRCQVAVVGQAHARGAGTTPEPARAIVVAGQYLKTASLLENR